jgi:pimeloyl-ACP methyl ester carboxylesterase
MPVAVSSSSFNWEGREISYDEYGSGDRLIVLIHGLLMNRHMFDRLGPELAERGNRVICVDLLGHGRSERPPELINYTMTLFARQVIELLDHVGVKRAVVGGTSLGSNVALETAHIAPERVRGIFCEMPVLDNALVACAAIFAPILLALRFGEPVFRLTSAITSKIPRTNPLIDLGLDWIRQDPRPSAAVLEGLFMGRVAPHHDERVKMEQPALVIGHHADPLHPFSDSGMLCEELPNARLVDATSILEWRLRPQRLDDELASFLDEVWSERRGGLGLLFRRDADDEESPPSPENEQTEAN